MIAATSIAIALKPAPRSIYAGSKCGTPSASACFKLQPRKDPPNQVEVRLVKSRNLNLDEK